MTSSNYNQRKMLEFGDLIRSRSSSFRHQIRRGKHSASTSGADSRPSSRRASSSQSSSPERSSSRKVSATCSPRHQPLGMFLLVPAVHSSNGAYSSSSHASVNTARARFNVFIICLFLYRHQPSPSIYGIGIWHARYSMLTQCATLTI